MKKTNYYTRQKAMCKALGIKQPPKKMPLWQKFKFVYKQLNK